MNTISHHRKTRGNFKLLFTTGTILHLLLLICVVDLYFKSPVNNGMTPHKTHSSAFAKRVVIFIADGLRSESIYVDKHKTRVPYLSELLEGDSAWGTVQTRVPTESRPGHVAILGGIYEDPSAIFTGWKANVVEFDSVVNQSNYAWSLGSPDIVNIFVKKDPSRQYIDSYDPSEEDFSGKLSTINLDTWVFNKMNMLMEACATIKQSKINCKTAKDECKMFCEDGNVYFLHLLGMDSAGHVHKPNSPEYLENLRTVDNEIRKTVRYFNNYFSDEETAFVFTSDHGMTNWGSHGDGSDYETQVPFILWGKGIRRSATPFNIEQADLTPLIASILGIPIPVNSIGLLHENLLNGSEHQISAAVHTNLKQLAEQYFVMKESNERNYFFYDYQPLRGQSELKSKLLEVFASDSVNIDDSKELIQHIMKSLNYIRNYYFYPKLVCIFTTFFTWMCYLALNLYDDEEDGRVSKRLQVVQTNAVYLFISIFIMTATYLMVCGSSLLSLIYIAMPLTMLTIFVKNHHVMNQLLILFLTKNVYMKILWMVLFIVIVELLVVGFFNRLMCGVVLVILSVWLFILDGSKDSTTYSWLISCLSMAVFLFIPPSTKFNYPGFILGMIMWTGTHLYYIFQLWKTPYKSRELNRLKFKFIPMVYFFITTVNLLYINYTFDTDSGVYMLNKAISWILSVLTIRNIINTPTQVLLKLYLIASYLLIPFTLMSVNYELLFYTLLTSTLYFWVIIETRISNRKLNIHVQHFCQDVEINYFSKDSDPHIHRRTLFYLSLCICYFFAIGNVASFNGFDPLWTKAFVSTFSPFTMCSLIIIKMIIPFFMITCSFLAINIMLRSNATKIFTILILLLDQMVLNFMFFITNQGSWKDIGKSISHFVVMEIMAIIMLILYVFAKYVLVFNIDSYVNFLNCTRKRGQII